MKLSKQGEYSVTLLKHSKQICKRILDELKNVLDEDLSQDSLRRFIITDGTAGNGGDSITFTRMFKHVYSVEKDIDEFNILQHNVKRLGLKNITMIHDSILNQFNKIRQQIL